MELDYWTSAKVVNTRRVPDPKDKSKMKWEVTVRRGEQDRVLHVDHVVMAVGFGGYAPNMPKIPGMVRFRFYVTAASRNADADLGVGRVPGSDLALDAAQACA